MIKFLTAFVNSAGVISGGYLSDMPVPEEFQPTGLTLVSVGSVITHEKSPRDLVNTLLPLLTISTDPVTGRHTVTLPDTAKQHVNSVFHHASTMNELAVAVTLNPLVAHWLSMRLHADHEIKDRMDEEAAKAPHLASVVKGLLHKRFTPYELTPLQRFERKARRIQAALAAPK